jgi:tRNA pseudouridine55 synthase
MFGFLNINKAAGMTSHDVVGRVRRIVGRKVKVGHAGTLDPAATGVLPVALGPATRLIEYLSAAHKGYRATVSLGTSTTTDDAEGEPLEQQPVPPLERAALEQALDAFRGPIMQVPPMVSAVHHQGQRLYDLARAGKTVERAPRPVTITRLELVDQSDTRLVLHVECSKGTYIRSLARDLGAALGCGAHLADLTRTFVGPFVLEQAVTLETLAQQGTVQPFLLPPETAVADWPTVTLDERQCQDIRNGRAISLPEMPAHHLRAHAPDGALLALLRHGEHAWQPEKVFA